MELTLEGKVALITGASRGIGRAIAKAYVDAGASVMLSSRKLPDLEEAAAAIGGDVDVVAANAGDPDRAAAAVERCMERFGRSEEHTSDLQSLMRISYAVVFLKKKQVSHKNYD